MTIGPVQLSLTEDVRATLKQLLEAALKLTDGDHVVDHLPVNPWGDVDRFRHAVSLPLEGEQPHLHSPSVGTVVMVERHELMPLREVLESLAESVSGGNPWVSLTDKEQSVVESVLARVVGR